MQTEKPGIYDEIEELLGKIAPPRMALVEQKVASPAALTDIGEGVRQALRSVELPAVRSP